MKFHIENIGRISSADFDIKPLTVFIGKANTNKTWAAYTLYGILRSLARNTRSTPFTKPLAHCPQLEAAITGIAAREASKIANLMGATDGESQQSIVVEVLRDEVFEAANPFGEDIHFYFNNDDIAAMLGIEGDTLIDARASLGMKSERFIEQGKIQALSITWNKQVWTVIGILSTGQAVQRYAFLGSQALRDEENLKDQIATAIQWMVNAIFDEAMAFPAERKGLATILAITDAARRELFAVNAGLNQPSVDYIRFLSPFQRIPERPASPSKILELLETEVMNGKATFHGTAEPRVFSFTGGTGPTVQMNASASFVRSMGGLDLYLRTVPNHDVIVIDEPEMNAHPEAQLKLVELFAMMANQGRHIIITTHSPYFVDHLNNLIQGGALSVDGRQNLSNLLKLGDCDAFISADKVSAYLFQEDGVIKNLIDDGCIDLESFAVESDYVGNLSRAITEAESE